MIADEQITSIEYEAKEYASNRASMNPYQWNQWLLELCETLRTERRKTKRRLSEVEYPKNMLEAHSIILDWLQWTEHGTPFDEEKAQITLTYLAWLRDDLRAERRWSKELEGVLEYYAGPQGQKVCEDVVEGIWQVYIKSGESKALTADLLGVPRSTLYGFFDYVYENFGDERFKRTKIKERLVGASWRKVHGNFKAVGRVERMAKSYVHENQK